MGKKIFLILLLVISIVFPIFSQSWNNPNGGPKLTYNHFFLGSKSFISNGCTYLNGNPLFIVYALEWDHADVLNKYKLKVSGDLSEKFLPGLDAELYYFLSALGLDELLAKHKDKIGIFELNKFNTMSTINLTRYRDTYNLLGKVTATEPEESSTNIKSLSLNYYIDTIAPTLTGYTPPNNSYLDKNGKRWEGAESTLTINAADSGSGVKSISPASIAVNNTYSEGKNTVKITLTDNVGNTTSSDLIFYKDATGPVITGAGNIGYVNANANFSISATDDGCGVKALSHSSISASSYDEHHKLHEISITATDNLGNSSSNVLSFTIDSTPPVLSVNTNSYISGEWTKENVTVSIYASDAHSGLSSLVVNGNNKTSGFNAKYTDTIEIELDAKAYDKCGNYKVGLIEVKVDKKVPDVKFKSCEFNKFNQPSVSNPEEGITSFSYGYDYLDEHSGPYSTYIDYTMADTTGTIESNDNFNFNELKTSGTVSGIFNINQEPAKKRDKDYLITMNATVKDKVSNTNNASTTLLLPKRIDGCEVGIASLDQKTGIISIPIEVCSLNKDSYSDIYIQRVFYAGEKLISKDSFNSDSPLYTNEEFETWQKLTELIPIKDSLTKNDNGTYSYTDTINVKTGFGHKNIEYKIYIRLYKEYGGTEGYTWLEYNSKTNRVLLPNNPRSIEWRLMAYTLDDQGNRNTTFLDLNENGDPVNGTSLEDFKIPSTGKIDILFRSSDYDMEPTFFELKKIVEAELPPDLASTGFELGIPVEGACSNGYVSGCAGFDKVQVEGGDERQYFSTEKESNDGWIVLTTDYELSYNIDSTFYISSNEGYFGGKDGEYQSKTKTNIMRFRIEAPDIGGFRLKISPTADYTYSGIYGQPFREIEMGINNISLTDAVFTWNMGDGSTDIEKTEKIAYAYDQSPDRTGNTSNYTLSIYVTINNHTYDPIEIPVHIVDTQYGILYGPEVWKGRHVLLSTVFIPDGITLTIGDSKAEEDMQVLCYGDLGLEFNPDFDFQSGKEPKSGIWVMPGGILNIDNNDKQVEFIEMMNSTSGFIPVKDRQYGWGTIYLRPINNGKKAAAHVKNTVIRYAENGFTLGEGSELTISNTLFVNNNYGIKIIGITKLSMENSTFEFNDTGVFVCENSEISLTYPKFNVKDTGTGITACDNAIMYLTDAEISNGLIGISAGVNTSLTLTRTSFANTSLCIKGTGTKLSLINGVFTNGQEGLYLENSSNVSVIGTSFNNINTGIRVTSDSNLELDNCDFTGGTEGIHLDENTTSNINNSRFQTIQGRAVTISPKAVTAIEKSTFKENLIGLHVFGNSTVTLSNCEITGNKHYGIKEDRESGNTSLTQFNGVTFNGITVTGNLVDYYDWYKGVLTQEEIEAKIGK